GEFGNAGLQTIEAVGGAIAAAGIAEAMKGIADAYRECVQVAGDFEQAMSAVEAIADSNTSEMAALTAEAKELGATTKFTAQQSANAMEYMAMAGWDAQEMLGGMNGVINLAAAAGEDLAQVSDIVTDNLSAFGLRASDTAHFADVL
ncbi:MAG: phage tail tape measure protein, partial [Dysosmobacter sp.]|nr:phage tail tape measure protein [Dysosmobacter sp.]